MNNKHTNLSSAQLLTKKKEKKGGGLGGRQGGRQAQGRRDHRRRCLPLTCKMEKPHWCWSRFAAVIGRVQDQIYWPALPGHRMHLSGWKKGNNVLFVFSFDVCGLFGESLPSLSAEFLQLISISISSFHPQVTHSVHLSPPPPLPSLSLSEIYTQAYTAAVHYMQSPPPLFLSPWMCRTVALRDPYCTSCEVRQTGREGGGEEVMRETEGVWRE